MTARETVDLLAADGGAVERVLNAVEKLADAAFIHGMHHQGNERCVEQRAARVTALAAVTDALSALAAHPAPAAEAEVEAVADMHREIVALTGWATMAEIEPKEAAFQDALRRLAAERAMHKNNALNWQDACNKADDAVAAAVAADNGHE
jgi:hypothetical protein